MSGGIHENVRVKVSLLLFKIVNELREESKEPTLRFFFESGIDMDKTIENIDMLMPQEIYVSPNERFRVDMVFGNFLVFEFKSSESEFDEAVKKAREVYLPGLPTAKYYVVTNGEKWRFYKINRVGHSIRLAELSNCSNQPVACLKQIISREYKALGIPPTPKNIEALFETGYRKYSEKLFELFNKHKDMEEVKPLFEAYKRIIIMLYNPEKDGRGEEEIKKLFVKHTYLHIVAMASLAKVLDINGSPVDLCSGAYQTVDVALPYLNWWKIIFYKLDENDKTVLMEITEDIVSRASLLDWKLGGEEDVFRRLYEVLVEPETRRKIGEYYTPLWLVDKVLAEFNLKEKLVVDPFCGSGTFLVKSFYKKVEEGENAENAYKEVVGLDVNPLAVAIARAELIIAYRKKTGKSPQVSPHIYHTDTLAAWFGNKELLLQDQYYKEVFEILKTHFAVFVMEKELRNVLSQLSNLERVLAIGIRLYMLQKQDNLKTVLLRMLGSSDMEQKLGEILEKEEKFIKNLEELIEKFGDGVWAITLVSSIVPILLEKLRPDVIVTNPPWVPMTEYQAVYIHKIREDAKKLLSWLEERRAASIVTGSDVATMALHKALTMAREGVGFVMNRDQSFHSGGSAYAGIILTYATLKKWLREKEIKLIDVDYDAFGHGIYPALVIAKTNTSTTRLCKLTVLNASKDEALEDVELKEEELGITYEDYINPGVSWASKSAATLTGMLGVEDVKSMGAFIRGLFGGEKKKEKKRYAGLIIESYYVKDDFIEIKLYNLDRTYCISIPVMHQYGINIYRLYYVDNINPYLYKTYDVLLSKYGVEKLKEFLRVFIQLNQNMTVDDREKIQKLRDEVKANVKIFNKDKYYALYRTDRIFAACVVCGSDDNAVPHSTVSYIECISREQALYYVSVLNYLAYKVIEMGRTFERHQLGKPLNAIVKAGLSWKDVPQNIKDKVVQYAECLMNNLTWREYPNKKKAIKDLAKIPEFRNIINTLDCYIQCRGIDISKTLEYVSKKGSTKNQGNIFNYIRAEED